MTAHLSGTMRWSIVCFVLALPFGGPLDGAEPLRVLFIGNSYTYFNNLPEIFEKLARAALPDRSVETRMVAVPGQTLVSLWERSEARSIMRSAKWDYVVLQDQSQLGDGLRNGKFVVNAPTLLHWGARLFANEAKAVGARIALLLTWSRRSEPHQQADLNFAYDSIARELGALLVPAGPAWQLAVERRPALDLYAKDGSHPTATGSYLIACVLLASLLPESGGELPPEISGHPVSGAGVVDSERITVLSALSREEARALQNIARKVVVDMRGKGGYLNAEPPEQSAITQTKGVSMSADMVAGSWTGELIYYPSRATLDLNLRFKGDQCEGDVVIRLPDRRQRYDAPVTSCSISGQQLQFSVATLPLPFLIDRFTGWMSGDRLIGSVDRTGRELTNTMSGVWSLARPN